MTSSEPVSSRDSPLRTQPRLSRTGATGSELSVPVEGSPCKSRLASVLRMNDEPKDKWTRMPPTQMDVEAYIKPQS
jgi:hypothetical protein